MTILHIREPNIQVFVTSQMTEGGAQKSMTNMSAMARFTMKMLVTDCIDLVVVTAMKTWQETEIIFCFKKWVNPGLFFILFSVFLSKQYNFYSKSM